MKSNYITARALLSIRPGAEFSLRGDKLEWLDSRPQPSDADIAAEIARLHVADAVDGYRAAVDRHIETTARARDYASSVHCVSYMHSTIEAWAADAAAFVAWRDAVWGVVYAALDAWQAGGEAPTSEALIASLPPMEWPEA
jgi:hypothetical protein